MGDSTPFPGCPQTDDLAVLKSNDPPPDSPISAQDLSDLRELCERLTRICTRARERNVCVVIDAEQSWFQVRSARLLLYGQYSPGMQPAVDSISLALMREFNREPPSFTRWLSRLFSRSLQHGPPPLIYVTCQAYLRR